MTTFSNWTIVQKMSNRSSKYAQYKSRLAIIITTAGETMFTPAADEALGRPSHVEILLDQRARRFAIRATNDVVTGYKVQPNGGGKSPSSVAMRKINPSKFNQSLHLVINKRAAIYNATMDDDGLLVVDMKQNPEVV